MATPLLLLLVTLLLGKNGRQLELGDLRHCDKRDEKDTESIHGCEHSSSTWDWGKW